MLPALISAAVGTVFAIAVAIGLSERFPISLARQYDLRIGYHADWLVLGVAVVAVLVAVLTIAVVSALWAVNGRRPVNRTPSTVGRWTAQAGLPPRWQSVRDSRSNRVGDGTQCRCVPP